MKRLLILISATMLMIGCGKKSSSEMLNDTSLGESQVVEQTQKEKESSEEQIDMEEEKFVKIPFGYLTGEEYKEYFTLNLPVKTTLVGAMCEAGTKTVDVEANITCEELVVNASEYQMDYAMFLNGDCFGGTVIIMGNEFNGTFDEFSEVCLESYKTEEGFVEDSGKIKDHSWYSVGSMDKDEKYSYVIVIQFDENIAFTIGVYGANGKIIYDVDSAHNYMIQSIQASN